GALTPTIDPSSPTRVVAAGAATCDGVPLRVGTAPRLLPNVRGPHGISETFRMSKRFPLSKREGTFFGLGMTMTNPFNRTCRYINSTDRTDPTFGMLFAGCGGRTVQLDARVEF